uniref:Uncharacterized protein n=1 Tax=Tribolium castaneum TaxID=7070 RepID=A5I8K9_TRICA|nr:hypothetical protein [Tribolium castaneum]
MSTRICIPISSGRTNGSNFSKFINCHYTSGHLLGSSSLPLRSFYRSRIRYQGRISSLILPIYGLSTKPKIMQGAISNHIQGSKPNILSSAFPRLKRNARTIF